MNRTPHDGRRPDEGIAVIWVAVFLLVSLWFVSLAIDMGKLMAAKTQLQAAADAAALAGASSVDPETGDLVQDSARVRAAEVAAANAAYEGVQTSVVIDAVNDVSFPTPKQVRVIVRREAATGNPVLTHFAQTLGIPNLSVNADATAEVQQLGEPCERLAPFAPEDVPDSAFNSDCGSEYTLKDGSGQGQQGNFQLLELPDCNEDAFSGGGAAAIYQYVRYGYDCCMRIDDEWVYSEPGNKVGPFRAALQDRFDADTDSRQGICYQEYTGNSSRVFITPIIESFDVSGKKLVRIVKFAAFFLKDRPGGSMTQQGVKGQFIKFVVPGNPGPDPPDDSMLFGIHLVE
ncbi:MAG TPA: pilus assembly protein TadG-related protein [Acidobacteriota bacterium]|nr:pilus assembly protein TadG-related protein [Acidobacteriota bacterium]